MEISCPDTRVSSAQLGLVALELSQQHIAGVFRFPEILMSPVTDIVIDSPKSFVMTFANGLELRLVDTCDEHDSFSVGSPYF